MRAVDDVRTIVRSLAQAVILVALLACTGGAAADSLTPSEAALHVGETVTVCGHVVSAAYAARANGQPTFLNFGKAYPDQEFTALIWGTRRAAFPYAPESLKGQTVCVRGTISTYRGRPQIVVTNPSQLERLGDEKNRR